MAACSRRGASGIRNKALIAVLWRACLRISEALELRPKDLDRKAGTVRVLHGKNDEARTVGMDERAFDVVERWMEKRATLKKGKLKDKPSNAPVFCTLDGRQLDTSYVRHAMRRLRDKAGIEKRVHAHGLRHTCAAEMAEEGIPLNEIQQQLGHKNIATTSGYLDHVRPQKLIDTMRAREW